MWRLEDNLYDLLRACTQILSPTPLFILLNAYTAGFSPHAYGNVLQAAAPAGTVSVSEIGLQATSGIVLPCGSFARWLPN
jgi:23S rRNA (cytosine1962-C5)-methyltransferase